MCVTCFLVYVGGDEEALNFEKCSSVHERGQRPRAFIQRTNEKSSLSSSISEAETFFISAPAT